MNKNTKNPKKFNRNMRKPTAGLLAKIKALGGSTKGIVTYRDAENYIKRLQRKAKDKKVGVPKNGDPCDRKSHMKKGDKTDRLPVIEDGFDTITIRLPDLGVNQEISDFRKAYDAAMNRVLEAITSLCITVLTHS